MTDVIMITFVEPVFAVSYEMMMTRMRVMLTRIPPCTLLLMKLFLRVLVPSRSHMLALQNVGGRRSWEL